METSWDLKTLYCIDFFLNLLCWQMTFCRSPDLASLYFYALQCSLIKTVLEKKKKKKPWCPSRCDTDLLQVFSLNIRHYSFFLWGKLNQSGRKISEMRSKMAFSKHIIKVGKWPGWKQQHRVSKYLLFRGVALSELSWFMICGRLLLSF